MTITPAQGSYVEVDGLSIYYELHGEGPSLVLLHRGLLAIELAFGDVLPALAERHTVVAMELEGHGRTADIDRPLSLERLAEDVARVLTLRRHRHRGTAGRERGATKACERHDRNGRRHARPDDHIG